MTMTVTTEAVRELTEAEAAQLELARTYLGAALEAKGEDYIYTPEPRVEGVIEGGACLYLKYDAPATGFTNPILEGCQPTGEASCIVGHVLVYAGHPLREIACIEGKSAFVGLKALSCDPVFTEPLIINAFDVAQAAQDAGATWSSAVARFEQAIADRHDTSSRSYFI